MNKISEEMRKQRKFPYAHTPCLLMEEAAEEIDRLEAKADHYQEQWSNVCNDNQCLINDLNKLQAVHFEQNKRMTEQIALMREALESVILSMLPRGATPTQMRGWGAPWPMVANALWGGEK